jgi:uncharacterized protein
MELALVLSAFMLGLAGTPHCAAMCGASCAGVLQGCSSGTDARPTALAFHAARVAGYAVAGALAAAGVGVLAMAGSAAPLVRPIWTLLHVAALALGLWLMITGRQPAFMTRVGRSRSSVPAAAGGGWQTMSGPIGGAAAGAAWVAWPCGLLQSALVVAALANTAQGGAAAMAAFAIASATGLQLAPWMMARLGGASGSAAFAVRIAGAALAAGSAWAMGHDLWGKVVAYCTT